MEDATQHFLDGQYELALKEFEQALEQVPPEQHSIVHANRGAAMMSVGDVEGAVEAFNQALAVDPDHLEALHNKGVALSELGKLEEACKCFERVCEKAPDFYAGQCGRSETYAQLGKYDQAVEAANLAIKSDSETSTAYSDKAFALLKLRRFKESSEAYESAVQRGDDSAETKRLFSLVLSQYALEEEEAGDKTKALELIKRSCELVPNPQTFHNRGIILVSIGKIPEAIECFQAAIKEEDSYFESHAALGVIFAQNEKLDDSCVHLEKACSLDPKSIETRYNLGVIRIKKGQVEQARKEWMTVLEIEPGEPHATEAIRILDAALAEAKAKGSDGKAETKAAAKKISDISAATGGGGAATADTAVPSTGGARLEMGPDGKPRGMTATEADNLIQTLDKLDQALSSNPQPTTSAAAAGGRRKSVLETKATSGKPIAENRTFVRDVSAAPTIALRKAGPKDDFGALEAKLTSALSKLEVEPDAIERRKSYSLGPRAPGTLLPERPKMNYKDPSEVTFSYGELKNKLPQGVDPTRKEDYLTPEEFQKTFGKTREEFAAFPAWKKIREKKRLGLF